MSRPLTTTPQLDAARVLPNGLQRQAQEARGAPEFAILADIWVTTSIVATGMLTAPRTCLPPVRAPRWPSLAHPART